MRRSTLIHNGHIICRRYTSICHAEKIEQGLVSSHNLFPPFKIYNNLLQRKFNYY